jgi:prepilin-type N-terminal cleavage/methylation domain-containing protein
MRGFTAVELAAAVAVVGSLVAIAVPTLIREIKSSRLVEPTEGLAAIASGAVAYAGVHGTKASVALAFPRSVGLTPTTPPAGHLAADPPCTWNDPTWVALGFPASLDDFRLADGEPHAFSFAFDSSLAPAKSTFVAHAHADLDGDGATSTFEVRGQDTLADGPTVLPGMYVSSEFE